MSEWKPTTMEEWMREVGRLRTRVERSGRGPRDAHGRVVLPAYATGTGGSIAVTFPEGTFEQAPDVFLTSGDSRLGLAATAVTATGFTISISNRTTGGSSSCLCYWQAR